MRYSVLRSILKLSTIEEEQKKKNEITNTLPWMDGTGEVTLLFILLSQSIPYCLTIEWHAGVERRGGRKISLACRKCIRVTIWKFHSKIVCFTLLLSATFYCKMPVIDCWLGLLHQTELFLDANISLENREHCVMHLAPWCHSKIVARRTDGKRHWQNRITDENRKRTSRENVSCNLLPYCPRTGQWGR